MTQKVRSFCEHWSIQFYVTGQLMPSAHIYEISVKSSNTLQAVEHSPLCTPSRHADWLSSSPYFSVVPEPGEEELHLLHGLGVPALRLGHELDRTLRRTLPLLSQDEVAVVDLGELVEHAADQVPGVLSIGLHVLHDHGYVDVLEAVPAVVVGRHADHLVPDLRLAGELGLGEDRHVDDAAAPGAVHVALGTSRELGALHADDGTLGVEDDAVALHVGGARLDDVRKTGVEGIREADVTDNAALEECEGTNALCSVDNLIWDEEVHGLDLLLEGPDGAEGDDGADADVAQSRDVGARGHLVRCVLVELAMPREEGDGRAVVLDDLDRRGGESPGRLGVQGSNWGESIDLAETGSANDGDMNRA